MNQIKNLSLIGIFMAFVVIALGAWTRLVDAGLGCPDWPGCYGFVFWPNDEAVSYTHLRALETSS